MIQNCELCQYIKERAVNNRDYSAIWTTATARYKQSLNTPFFADQAVETTHSEVAALPRSGNFAHAPQNIPQSLEYFEDLPRESFDDDLQSMDSAFLGKEELQTKENRAL